jgi:hypothetical protein
MRLGTPCLCHLKATERSYDRFPVTDLLTWAAGCRTVSTSTPNIGTVIAVSFKSYKNSMDLHECHYDIFRGRKGDKVSFPTDVVNFPRGPARKLPHGLFFYNEKYLFQLVSVLKQKENRVR